MIKQVVLSIAFLFLLLIIKNLESYSFWYEEKITKGYEDVEQMKEITDLTKRKEMRLGGTFHVYENILKAINDSVKGKTNIVLVPSNEYFRENKLDLKFDEPPVIYYLSNLQTVLPYTEMAQKANWAVILRNGQLDIKHLKQKGELDSLIAYYKTYKYIL